LRNFVFFKNATQFRNGPSMVLMRKRISSYRDSTVVSIV